MTKRTVYVVRAERTGDGWGLTAPEVEVTTYVRRLREAEAYAREAIAWMTRRPEDSFDIHLEVHLPGDLDAELARARETARAAEQMQREAAEATRSVTAVMRDKYGISGADIADALGISQQRVSQLLKVR